MSCFTDRMQEGVVLHITGTEIKIAGEDYQVVKEDEILGIIG